MSVWIALALILLASVLSIVVLKCCASRLEKLKSAETFLFWLCWLISVVFMLAENEGWFARAVVVFEQCVRIFVLTFCLVISIGIVVIEKKKKAHTDTEK